MASSNVRTVSKIRTIWPSTGKLPRGPAAAPHGDNFLPQDSVVISDRTRHANKLGEGSFAKVYRGEYNGKPCAVKVFKEDIVKKELPTDPGGTSEVEMLSEVQHTNIVQMYGMWFDPHKDRAAPSIVMELCDESLNDFIRRLKGKIVPNEKKLPILQDIARGMVYLHGQNIVHGDLRSSNVLLCHSGDQTVAKVADFVMARFPDTNTQHPFTVRFTAEEYLPPEVFSQKEHKDQKKWAKLTPKVDVFCFGELVLELACGMYPTPTGKFHGRETLTELQRREKHLIKLKQCDRECLSSIIQKCLADAPEGRPSFTEILLDVEECLHKYGERPALEVLQNKTAECETLRAEAVKWEGEAKSLCSMQDVEKDEKEGLRRQLQELHRDHELLRRAKTRALQEKADHCQRLKTDLATTERERDCAREEISVLRQENRSLEESLKVLSHEKKDTEEKLNISKSTESRLQQRIDDLEVRVKDAEHENHQLKEEVERERQLLKEKNLKLQGELTENKRASEADRNELVAAKVQRQSAEKERDEQAEKCLLACQERETFRNEAEEVKKELKTLKEECSTLQHKVSVLETDNASLKERFSHIEDDKNKLQASLEDSNEWIMHNLCTQDKEGSPKQLSEKTEFHTMMELFKEYYERVSKWSEQTAEENQQLLASNDKLKEKVQELTQGSQALQSTEVVHVPLASDVVDVTADEVLLQQLCYMATGIKQLLISPDGGTFKLGSGDASLEFPPGAVVEETSARYAVILHGPFMFPAGYKPGSVIIYLNFNGTTLLKPVLLYLSHWCIKEKGEDEDTLKFVSASHTLEAEHQAYVFEEEDDADFTRTNVGVLSIRDPHCLFCVKTKREKIAMYSAIAFSRYIPSEETLLFRIQLMCDSLEWNEKLTTTLQLKNWEKTSDGDVVTRFQYADGQHQITASPQEMSGPGWEAAINGQQGVMDQMFLGPLRKSKDEVEQEVINGRFPPCILYQIIYNSPQKKRTRPALLKVNLNGADVPLVFNCRIKEEMYATSPVSPAFFSAATSSHTPDRMAASYGPSPATSGQSAERHPSSPQAEISQPADILTALDHRLDAKWRYFGTFLRVEYQVLEVIQRDKGGNPEDCMLDLLSKWTSNQAAGMGTLPRTWQTVVEAVHHCGDEALAQSLARKHGGQLPH